MKQSNTNKQMPLVLLHGFTGSAETMQGLADTQTHRTICLNLIGHGKNLSSDKKLFTFESVNEQLQTSINQLNLEKIHLLGYSMGDRIALNFALHYPEQVASLTLISATAGIKSSVKRILRRRQDKKLAASIQNEGMKKFVTTWMEQPLFTTQTRLDKDWIKKARQQRMECDPIGLALSLRGLGTGKMKPLWKQLHKIHIPTLLITGTEDKKFTELSKQIQAHIPNSLHVKIQNTGHAPHLEISELVAKHIANFFGNL